MRANFPVRRVAGVEETSTNLRPLTRPSRARPHGWETACRQRDTEPHPRDSAARRGCRLELGGQADGSNGESPLRPLRARYRVDWLAEQERPEEGGTPDGSEGWRPRRETKTCGRPRSRRPYRARREGQGVHAEGHRESGPSARCIPPSFTRGGAGPAREALGASPCAVVGPVIRTLDTEPPSGACP
jgi:hypothetical protein